MNEDGCGHVILALYAVTLEDELVTTIGGQAC